MALHPEAGLVPCVSLPGSPCPQAPPPPRRRACPDCARRAEPHRPGVRREGAPRDASWSPGIGPGACGRHSYSRAGLRPSGPAPRPAGPRRPRGPTAARKFPHRRFEPFPPPARPICWEPLPGIRWQEADRIGGHHARQTCTYPRLRSRCTHGAADRDQRRFVAGIQLLKASGSLARASGHDPSRTHAQSLGRYSYVQSA